MRDAVARHAMWAVGGHRHATDGIRGDPVRLLALRRLHVFADKARTESTPAPEDGAEGQTRKNRTFATTPGERRVRGRCVDTDELRRIAT
jgi:hypothetical protein